MSWFRVHRGWTNNPVFARDKFSRKDAWLWLIENAQWEDGKRLKRGQLSVSVTELEEAWGWPRTTVFRFLTALKLQNMIETASGTFCSVISICNYGKYQGADENSEQQPEWCSGGHDVSQNRNSNRNAGGTGANPSTDCNADENPDAPAPAGTPPEQPPEQNRYTGGTPIKEGRKDSVPKGTGETPSGEIVPFEGKPAPPSPEQIVFSVGVPLLLSQGAKEASARSFLGQMVKDYGAADVARVVAAAVADGGKVEAKAWIAAALKSKNPNPGGNGLQMMLAKYGRNATFGTGQTQ